MIVHILLNGSVSVRLSYDVAVLFYVAVIYINGKSVLAIELWPAVIWMATVSKHCKSLTRHPRSNQYMHDGDKIRVRSLLCTCIVTFRLNSKLDRWLGNVISVRRDISVRLQHRRIVIPSTGGVVVYLYYLLFSLSPFVLKRLRSTYSNARGKYKPSTICELNKRSK